MQRSVDEDDTPTLLSSRPRFAPLPEALLLSQAVSDGAVRLWGVLDRIAARHRIWPGREYLAERLGCSTDTVDRRIGELRAGGWLEVRRRGQGRTNLYTLHDQPRGPESATVRTPEAAPVPSPEAAPVPSKREIAKREEVDTTRAAAEQLEAEAFATWWATYPRKVAKPSALKAWRAALRAGADLELLQGALEAWAVYWQARGEPEFVPHPATWLRREGWNDTPPATRPRGAALEVLDLLGDDWSLPPIDGPGGRRAGSMEGTATEALPPEVTR